MTGPPQPSRRPWAAHLPWPDFSVGLCRVLQKALLFSDCDLGLDLVSASQFWQSLLRPKCSPQGSSALQGTGLWVGARLLKIL